MCHGHLLLNIIEYDSVWSMHEDHVNAKDGRSDDVDDEDDVDHLDLQCVSWLSFIEYYSVWSMLLFTVLGSLDLSLKRWSNSADASAAQCTC